MVYLPRLADGELSSRLASSGAVLIEGPKACGKTETARRQAASEVRLDVDPRQRAAAEVTPGLILDQPPRYLVRGRRVAAAGCWDRHDLPPLSLMIRGVLSPVLVVSVDR